MKFHVLTLFPDMVLGALSASVVGRAIEKGLIGVEAVDIRGFTLEKHGRVDDYPYGGGAGMLMQAQPVYDAYRHVCGDRKLRTVYLTPQGKPFSQKMAEEFSKEEELVLLCGHYEGIDERVLEEVVTDFVSIGDYVLTGGELAAMVMIDAISRLVPGVLNNEESAEAESFHNDLLEYPQYTRPYLWHGKAVPQVLLSGNHRDVAAWRLARSEERTRDARPDLFKRYCKKKQAIEDLSRRKREHIHIMEALKRGKAELLFQDGANIMVYHRECGVILMTAQDPASGEEMLEALRKDLSKGKVPFKAAWYVVSQDFLALRLQETFQARPCGTFLQACYTRREPLPVRHKDIRRLSGEGPLFLAKWEEAWKRDGIGPTDLSKAGALYGAYLDGHLAGLIGQGKDGGMGFLYVEEGSRRQGVASSLEAYLINRQLDWGWTPYCQVPAGNVPALALQEKLGLYLSGGMLQWLRGVDS